MLRRIFFRGLGSGVPICTQPLRYEGGELVRETLEIDLDLHPSTDFGCALTSRCRTQPVCWLRSELSTAA
jgi:hypothetical protein